MKRRKPMNRYNKARMKKKRFDESGFKHTYGPQFQWASEQICDMKDVKGHVCSTIKSPAHHLLAVSKGGKDAGNLIPGCAKLHSEFHRNHISSLHAKYKLNFYQRALSWELRYHEGIGDLQ